MIERQGSQNKKMIVEIRNVVAYTKILLILFFTLSLKAHSQQVLAGFQLGPIMAIHSIQMIQILDCEEPGE